MPAWAKPMHDSIIARIDAITNRLDAVEHDLEESDKKIHKLSTKVDRFMESKKVEEPNEADKGVSPGEEFPEMQLELKAQKEQESTKFNANDVYTTLINPHARSGQELAKCVDEAVPEYKSQDYPELEEQFMLDFRYWTTEHFEKAKGGDLTKLRNILVGAGEHVSTKGPTRISVKLGDYLHNTRVQAERDKAQRKMHRSSSKKPPDTTCNRPRSAMRIVDSLDHDERSDYSEVHSYSAPSRSRPADVGKMFHKNQRYSVGPAENRRNRYRHFIDACNLSGVDTTDCGVMIPLMTTVFLTGQAEMFFSNRVRPCIGSPNEAIDALEAKFLDK